MLGSFRRRGCTCKKKRCTCGSKWTYRYHIIDPVTGKRKQKETRGFETKAEAEAEAKRILAEIEKGIYVDEKNITFAEFVPEFLKLYETSGKVKPGSVRVRKRCCNNLQNHFQNIKMKDITKKMYQDMLIELGEKYSKETITSIHATGRMLFQKAHDLGIIKLNPTVGAEIPRKQQTVEEIESVEQLPEFMEKDELAKFLNITSDHGLDFQDYPIFVTLAYTGIRVGELCALKWSDLDREEKTLSITKTIDNEKNNTREYKLVPPKTKSSIRVVEISDTVLQALNEQRKKQNLMKMEHRDTYHDADFIFTKNNARYGYYGYPFMQKDIGSRMKRLLKIAGLNTTLSPHSLRHTHTSLLAAARVSLETIQDRLGHKNDDMTRSVYLHVTKELKREASQKFEELMGGLK
ncbi:tyrosine-type recombinase/integrase [Paenibacillus sp. MB22_1]|uniref:tyrosine-type recombinase/integrase n=1 Tax=Paenibacillus sp. MB22_1 TaxID=3383121 RepID=UPI0039A0A0AF